MKFSIQSTVLVAALVTLMSAGRAAGEPNAQGIPVNPPYCPMLGLIISDAKVRGIMTSNFFYNLVRAQRS